MRGAVDDARKFLVHENIFFPQRSVVLRCVTTLLLISIVDCSLFGVLTVCGRVLVLIKIRRIARIRLLAITLF